MFSSVLRPRSMSAARLGLVVSASVTFHVALVAVTFFITTRPEPPKEDFSELVFLHRPPSSIPPPPGVRRPAARRKTSVVQPRIIPPLPAAPAQPSPPASEETGSERGTEEGPRGEPDGVPGGEIGAPASAPPLEEEAPISFGEGMTRPTFEPDDMALLATYTREALEAHIEGSLVITCQVLATGVVRRCSVLKPLPLMGQVMVERLERLRMRPATLEGAPVSISYVFNFSFTLPR